MLHQLLSFRRLLIFGAALCLPIFIILVISFSAGTAKSLNNPPFQTETVVIRVYYERIADIERLQMYDLWEFNNLEDKYVLIAAQPAEILKLKADGWIVVPDQAMTAVLERSLTSQPFLDGYHRVDDIRESLETTNLNFPDLTELVHYGQSHCLQIDGCITPGGDTIPGDDLLALRITNEAIPGYSAVVDKTVIEGGSKPVFFLLANIHSRELTTPELALLFIDYLLENYQVDPDITWLLDWHEIWILPTANPDGHRLVELGTTPPYSNGPFYQRKNANLDVNQDGTADCPTWPPAAGWQYGVDLNRNHSFAWGPPGSSADPCSQTFRGLTPASELEVSALQEFIKTVIPDQRGDQSNDKAPINTTGLLITLHNYSGLVLRPWGYTGEPAPNENGLKAIGDKLAAFNGYLSCQPSDCLYGANGTTDDWAYGELGIPSFTFEIGQEFMPPFAEVESIQWPENREAFLYGAMVARSPYELIFGPEVKQIQVWPTSETELKISAVIANENQQAASVVVGADYAIDTPFWASGAQPQSMEAADGLFDSPLEEATAVIDSSTLLPGRHMIFLRGVNNQGYHGITRAVFIEVPTDQPAKTALLPFIAQD